MTAGVSKAVADGSTTSVPLTLKRTVAKVAVQTSIDPAFASKYSGTLTVTGTKLLRAASQTPIIAPATPTPGAMSFTHTQTATATSGKYNNLFYLFENGPLAEASRVALEITATYDADGNASTTADRMEVVYTVPLTGKTGARSHATATTVSQLTSRASWGRIAKSPCRSPSGKARSRSPSIWEHNRIIHQHRPHLSGRGRFK